MRHRALDLHSVTGPSSGVWEGPPWAGREWCGVARCGRGGDGRRPGVASSPTGLRPG